LYRLPPTPQSHNNTHQSFFLPCAVRTHHHVLHGISHRSRCTCCSPITICPCTVEASSQPNFHSSWSRPAPLTLHIPSDYHWGDRQKRWLPSPQRTTEMCAFLEGTAVDMWTLKCYRRYISGMDMWKKYSVLRHFASALFVPRHLAFPLTLTLSLTSPPPPVSSPTSTPSPYGLHYSARPPARRRNARTRLDKYLRSAAP
jgi:hypothetical protein